MWRWRLLSRCELRQTVSRGHFPYVLSPSRGVEVVVGENRWRVGAGVFVEFSDGADEGFGGWRWWWSSFERSGRRWRARRVYVTRTWRREERGWVPVLGRGCLRGGDVLRWNR